MEGREDALVAAAEAVLRIRDAAGALEGAVATVGRVDVEPGGDQRDPGARSPLRRRAGARRGDCSTALVETIGLEPGERTEPVAMSPRIRAALADELAERELPVVELASGAGHDAGILAAAGVEAGMLFVRSLNDGVSHSPDELSSDDDVTLAVEVLGAALSRLVSSPGT